jgi:hypothetical protein
LCTIESYENSYCTSSHGKVSHIRNLQKKMIFSASGKLGHGQVWGLMPVIIASWEGGIRRIAV